MILTGANNYSLTGLELKSFLSYSLSSVLYHHGLQGHSGECLGHNLIASSNCKWSMVTDSVFLCPWHNMYLIAEISASLIFKYFCWHAYAGTVGASHQLSEDLPWKCGPQNRSTRKSQLTWWSVKNSRNEWFSSVL